MCLFAVHRTEELQLKNTAPQQSMKSENKKTASQSQTGKSSLRDEHRRVTNTRIADAAKNLFQEKGYRATSVNDIVHAAGTTATTFYRHFKSKANLAGIIQRELYSAVESQTKILDTVETLSDIRDWLDGYVVMWRQSYLLCEAYWEATLTDETLRRAIIPDTMSLTAKLTTIMSRLPDNGSEQLRIGMQLRLSLLILALDRIAYLAESSDSESQGKALLDEFAIVMHRALFEALPSGDDEHLPGITRL